MLVVLERRKRVKAQIWKAEPSAPRDYFTLAPWQNAGIDIKCCAFSLAFLLSFSSLDREFKVVSLKPQLRLGDSICT